MTLTLREQKFYNREQEIICQYFIKNIKTQDSDIILEYLDKLFVFSSVTIAQTQVEKALATIIKNKEKQVFTSILKRVCYILLNNWMTSRNYEAVQKLMKLLSSLNHQSLKLYAISGYNKQWLIEFVQSSDYQEIKFFADKYTEKETKNWRDRYATYLLNSQSQNPQNSLEQRQASQALYQQLKRKFKLDFALYTAHANSSLVQQENRHSNPSIFGNQVINVIKSIIGKSQKQQFNNYSLARIFQKQNHDVTYQEFKINIIKYLKSCSQESPQVSSIISNLSKYLLHFHPEANQDLINQGLIEITCNYVIEYFTTLEQGKPSLALINLVTQNKYLELSQILLSLILISQDSQNYLETCLAHLIQYYENTEESHCQWLIKLLETIQITLTIKAEDTEYNLVKMSDSQSQQIRIFSQVKPCYQYSF